MGEVGKRENITQKTLIMRVKRGIRVPRVRKSTAYALRLLATKNTR